MQHCNSLCSYCANVWFRWLKSREAQMRRPMRGEMAFADAAATSIKPSEGESHDDRHHKAASRGAHRSAP
jgi:pyruvate-formate lyase-activating enzyme